MAKKASIQAFYDGSLFIEKPPSSIFKQLGLYPPAVDRYYDLPGLSWY
jgi:hypothetical protein